MEFTDTGDCTSPWAGGGRGGTQEWEEPKKGNLGGAPEIQALQLVGVGQPFLEVNFFSEAVGNGTGEKLEEIWGSYF